MYIIHKHIMLLIFFMFLVSNSLLAEKFGYPVSSPNVTQLYNNYNSSNGGYHTGIDYGSSSGLNIIASASGTVSYIMTLAGDDHGMGNCVIIEHELTSGGYIYSLYAHLESIESSLAVGTVVSKEQIIGVMGGSGYDDPNYWAVHLHFEIKDSPVLHNPSGSGTYWGYTPSSADNYGYHNPENYFGIIDVIPPGEPYITVTNPQAGWTWNFAGTHLVEWDYSGFSGDIAIDLYKGDVNQIRLVSSTPVEDKNEYVTLPDWLETGNDYRIGLSSVPSGDPWDFSDYFSIRKLTVIYPNGGETFNPSQVVNVQWTSDNVSTNLLIDLYKGGTNQNNWVATLASDSPNDGSENVTLPSNLTTGNDYLIGISGHGGYVWDFSNDYFNIEPEGWASVSEGVSVTPSTIYTGDTFGASFTLTEINGGSVTFSEITCAILDVNDNHLFDLDHHYNITVSAYGTWTYPTSYGYLNDPGAYKAVARGKVNDWFDFSTTGEGINPCEFTVYNPSGLENYSDIIPSDYSISQNYPNPFNSTTYLNFSLPKKTYVKISIFSLSGKELVTLVDREIDLGNHTIKWDAARYSTGIYLYKFESKDFSVTKKCMLIK